MTCTYRDCSNVPEAVARVGDLVWPAVESNISRIAISCAQRRRRWNTRLFVKREWPQVR